MLAGGAARHTTRQSLEKQHMWHMEMPPDAPYLVMDPFASQVTKKDALVVGETVTRPSTEVE